MKSPRAAAAVSLSVLPAAAPGLRPPLDHMLQAIRRHMGMEVAFISDAIKPPASRATALGSHFSVPVRLQDGRIYGTFCCFSHSPHQTLTERDLNVMRLFSEMAADQIQHHIDAQQARQGIEDRISAMLDSDGLRMVYQPIIDVASGRVAGFESLARFASAPYRTPDLWFAEAGQVGRLVELESRAIRLALASLAELPASVYVTINASPETIVKGALAQALQGQPLDRLVVEVTEHQAIERYEDIAAAIAPLQQAGLRIAIDDAGAGYASFRHVLNLHPHIVKLDGSITHAIDVDRSRRALAAALCAFAHETGCGIVAEGVETQAELDAVRALGIATAQGYHLGRPMSVSDAQAALRH